MQALENGNGDIVAQLVHMNVTLAENMNMLLKMKMQTNNEGLMNNDGASMMPRAEWK